MIEITNQRDAFRIDLSQIDAQVKATQLTKVQKLICKWFKITPETKYHFKLSVRIIGKHHIKTGDFVMSDDGHKWIVCRVHESNGWIQMNSVLPLIAYGRMHILLTLGRTVPEA